MIPQAPSESIRSHGYCKGRQTTRKTGGPALGGWAGLARRVRQAKKDYREPGAMEMLRNGVKSGGSKRERSLFISWRIKCVKSSTLDSRPMWASNRRVRQPAGTHAGHEDDRQRHIESANLLRKLRARHVWQLIFKSARAKEYEWMSSMAAQGAAAVLTSNPQSSRILASKRKDFGLSLTYRQCFLFHDWFLHGDSSGK